MEAPTQLTFLDHAPLRLFMLEVLARCQLRDDCAAAVVNGLVTTSLRGVDSHGIGLFPHYVTALRGGRINSQPEYTFRRTSASTGVLDADHAFGHAAALTAMQHAIELAAAAGIGAVGVCNSSHSGAAACAAFPAAAKDMMGFSFTHATPLMKTPGAAAPFTGANPICCVAPMADEEPFCLDMSTTQISFNAVKAYRERREFLSPGLAYDENGDMTLDPDLVYSLAPIGIYKGFGLSIVVDILCGLLTGMPTGDQVSDMYHDPISTKRRLGHFVMAIDIARFEEVPAFKRRLQDMAKRVRAQRAKPGQRVLFPGDPEKEAFARRSREGIPTRATLLGKFRDLAADLNVPWNV